MLQIFEAHRAMGHRALNIIMPLCYTLTGFHGGNRNLSQVYLSPGPGITGNRHTDRGLENYVNLHCQKHSLAQSFYLHFPTLKESSMNAKSVRLSICVYL